jgi:hypothetical protein
MTGTTLDAVDYVPRSVLEHVGKQLEMSVPELATLRALYRRPMTLFLHQRWACEYAGFHRHDARDVTYLIDTLLSDISVTLDRHRLAQRACEVLYARRCLIPGERDIADWLRRAICLIELQDRRYLLLLSALRWTAARSAFLERHHLPATADPFIERVLAQIGSGCEGLNAALAAGELMISPRGHVILRDDPAVTSERSDAELLRNQLYARVGRAQLTELLLAVDGETHFSWELLGRPPVAPEELVPVYAALFVAAMGLDMTDAAIMIPGVRLADIRRASRLL